MGVGVGAREGVRSGSGAGGGAGSWRWFGDHPGIIHGYILTKFYRRKRRQETYNKNLNKKGHRNQQKVSFSSEESVKINQIVTRRLDTRDNQKVARRLSELSFHVSYIKSSNYIILTLSAFCFCHLPMYFHQLFELIR